MAFTRGHKGLLLAGFRHGEAFRGFQLLDTEPAVSKRQVRITQDNTAFRIGVEYAQVVVFSGGRVIAGVPDLHGHIFERILGDFVQFQDLDNRTGRVLEIDMAVFIGVQGRKLGLLCKQIGLRHRDLNDLDHHGQEVLHHGGARLVRLHLVDGVAVRRFHQVNRPGDWISRGGVPFVDVEVRPDIVRQRFCAVFARKYLNVVLFWV